MINPWAAVTLLSLVAVVSFLLIRYLMIKDGSWRQ